jgi:Protein of unknown function (Hypoth_ymh)
MLCYEELLRAEFRAVSDFAELLRRQFDQNFPADVLSTNAKDLRDRVLALGKMLPSEVGKSVHLHRHLEWMERRLSIQRPDHCRSDIDDICQRDIPELLDSVFTWWQSAWKHDAELMANVRDLLHDREFDSAVRKAFVILKNRIIKKFDLSSSLDGQDLANAVFGTKGVLPLAVPSGEREAMRYLLTGLYGVFRNKYMHEHIEGSWHEAEAVVSMVNVLLLRIDDYPSAAQAREANR